MIKALGFIRGTIIFLILMWLLWVIERALFSIILINIDKFLYILIAANILLSLYLYRNFLHNSAYSRITKLSRKTNVAILILVFFIFGYVILSSLF